MTHAWFHIPDLAGSSTQWIARDEAKHALGSRRLAPGDPVTLFDGRGRVAQGQIADERRHDGALAIRVQDVLEAPRRAPAIHLACALPKGDRSASLIESCVPFELASFVALACERSVQRLSPSLAARLERVAIESCKQSHQPWSIMAREEQTPEQAVRVASGRVLIAHPGGAPLDHCAAGASACTLLIGPEGGFTTRELEQCEAAGATRVSLGPTILRVELAAAAVIASLRL